MDESKEEILINNEHSEPTNPSNNNETSPDLPEARSLVIYGIPKRYKAKAFEKVLKELDIKFNRVIIPNRQLFAKIKFETPEHRMFAQEKLEGYKINDCVLQVRKPHDTSVAMSNKKRKVKDEPPKSIFDVITPWHEIPYEEQLQRKEREITTILKKITSISKSRSTINLPNWLTNLKHNDKCCELEPIIPSPILTEYRNKTEYCIGYDHLGNIEIGFLFGSTKDGNVAVGDPTNALNTSKRHDKIRQLFKSFIISTNHPAYSKLGHTGLWRLLMVRTNEKGDAMVLLQVNPKFFSKESLDELKEKLAQFIKENNNEDYKLKSVYVQEFDGISNAAPDDSPKSLIYGDPLIYEEILGTKFSISPTSFFQVNTPATNKLYNLIIEWCGESEKPIVVLDICCGTGTIGLCIAKNKSNVQNVIGVDIIEDAINDARKNSELNNVQNTTYICGKAEDAIDKIIKEHVGDVPDVQYVAVLDPPRSGCHSKVIKAIRKCELIKKVIYVSCNQKSLLNDAPPLIRGSSNSLKSSEFSPKKARAVDLFPHTPHCELVMLFERENK